MMNQVLRWMAAPVAVLMLGGCATMDQDARINFLEGQVKDILEKSAEWGVTSKDFRIKMADYTAQMDTLQNRLMTLSGRLEEYEAGSGPRENPLFSQQGIMEELQSLKARVQELEMKIAQLEAGLPGGAATTRTSPRVSSAPSAPARSQAPSSEKSLYNSAMERMKKRQYDSAIREFRKFVKTYPRSDLADNAQYWIGESYYGLKRYEEAIIEFEEVIQRYPDGDKVPAALLKEGLAFHKLKDNGPARQILNKLIDKYPKSEEAQLARGKLAELQ
ncbi:MAG: tol-pal system protein YbgF [bacterium]|nr:tol-pal system protein YbgF [bacterium]